MNTILLIASILVGAYACFMLHVNLRRMTTYYQSLMRELDNERSARRQLAANSKRMADLTKRLQGIQGDDLIHPPQQRSAMRTTMRGGEHSDARN